MIDKRQIIKEHLKDCAPDQLHDGSYVTIKECVEMMEILEQQLVKNLGLHNVIVPKGTVCEHPKPWKNTPWGYKVCPKCNDIVEREQTAL